MLDVINNVYAEHKDKDRDVKRHHVREALVGQTVMTNYGKARYIRIDEILFANVNNQKIDGPYPYPWPFPLPFPGPCPQPIPFPNPNPKFEGKQIE